MTFGKAREPPALESKEDLRALLERMNCVRTTVSDERRIAQYLMSTDPSTIEFEVQPSNTLWCMAYMIKMYAQLKVSGEQLVEFLNLEASFLQMKATMNPDALKNLQETGDLCKPGAGLFTEPVLNAFFERHFGEECLKSVPITGWKIRGSRKAYVANAEDREAVNQAFEEADALMVHYGGSVGHWATPALRTTLVDMFPDRDDDTIVFNMDGCPGAGVKAPCFAKPGVPNPPSVYDTPGMFGSDSTVHPTRVMYAVLDTARLKHVDTMLSSMSIKQYALPRTHIYKPPPLPYPPLPDSP